MARTGRLSSPRIPTTSTCSSPRWHHRRPTSSVRPHHTTRPNLDHLSRAGNSSSLSDMWRQSSTCGCRRRQHRDHHPQGRILGALVRLDGPRTISEVARLADISRDRAASVVADLERIGVVERRRAGRAHLVSLIDENPLSQSVRDIERARDRSIDTLRHAARAIEPAPVFMALFGAWARGEATDDSDLDVAVIASQGHDDDALLEALEVWSRFAERVTGRHPSLLIAERPTAGEDRCGRRCIETPSASLARGTRTMAREDSVAIATADTVAHCRQAHEYLRAAEQSLSIGDLEGTARAGGPVRLRRWRRGTGSRQTASAHSAPQDAVALHFDAGHPLEGGRMCRRSPSRRRCRRSRAAVAAEQSPRTGDPLHLQRIERPASMAGVGVVPNPCPTTRDPTRAASTSQHGLCL